MQKNKRKITWKKRYDSEERKHTEDSMMSTNILFIKLFQGNIVNC